MTSADSVTPVLPPLEVDDAAAVAWTEEADVVVVGWGAAGACAAIEARDQGASVIVVDRFEGGGDTRAKLLLTSMATWIVMAIKSPDTSIESEIRTHNFAANWRHFSIKLSQSLHHRHRR